MNRTRTAIIIGGGIAGPATAMALAKAGIDATVYEARPGGADGDGVMLTLAVNGIDALRAIDADTAAAAVAAGFPTPQITLRTHTGKRLGVTSTGGALADGTVARTTRRADLYQALHSQAVARGITAVGGKRLVGAEEIPDGVRAVFADGTEAQADILIGCDGVPSTVRRLIDPAAPAPSYAGLLTTGGYARGVRVPGGAGQLRDDLRQASLLRLCHRPRRAGLVVRGPSPAPRAARGEAEAISNAQWRQRFAEVYAEDAGPGPAADRRHSRLRPYDTDPHHPAPQPLAHRPDDRRWGRGARAVAHLRADSAGSLYGTTYSGGASGAGVVFKLDMAVRRRCCTASQGADGGYPHAGLIRDSAGNLYGTSYYGGASNSGVVFTLDTACMETVL